ncbi:recombinase family protein [Bacillus cereus group sp. TH152-1LC]|uniref:recombinase family protein n=1 Tax=Bacillus cereus group sp. TH152-1LC TaxID=3018060 RepID=UPI0022E73951|nr:recombinase family protein [Bacillus cereus group sp. TH152-1LC]MDA1678985.1 recombinase family protein [Bacillus cereus group sp. TH152-1LC]
MKRLYGKLVGFVVAIGLTTGCDSSMKSVKEKEVCKAEEECVKIGDKKLQKVYEKIDGLSELEAVEDYDIEEHKSADMKEVAQKKEDDENYFFLASYYIDGDEIVDPYFEKIERKRLNKVFAEDKEAKEEVLQQRQDRGYHEDLWDMYRTLIPAKYRGNITEFDLITDGYDGVVAHVMPSMENPKDWTLSLDILDSAVNIDEVMKTLIHETAHVLTLGHKQIPVDEKYLKDFDEDKDISNYRSNCEMLFLQEGCARGKSYINQFYNSFWKDIEQEWTEKKVEESEEAQIEFFKEKHEEFVSQYGTTNVAEDIADTFTAFILQDSKKVKEGSELKYKKIAFFYQFPELVKMRAEVLTGLYDVSKTLEQQSGH